MTEAELSLVERCFGIEYANRFAEWWQRSKNSSGFNRVSHNSCAREGEPFLALILLRKFLPNQQSRFCTVELKVRTAKRFLMSLGWQEWTNCIGLRADEPRRIKEEGVKLKDRWTVWQPLNHAGVTKRIVAKFWAEQDFDLRLPNVNGNCWLGNCNGCFLKSEAHVAAFHRDYPNLSKWWECAEKLIQSMWPALSRWQRLRRIVSADREISTKLREGYGRPIPSSVIMSMVEKPRSAGQFSKRYSREELRRFVDSQGDWIFDTEDALCQADGGECTG
jgi:3'-phosphoadenosine 5'-phosphosulfate sulfotransferase (PAPS reductase)/FAD synthetase